MVGISQGGERRCIGTKGNKELLIVAVIHAYEGRFLEEGKAMNSIFVLIIGALGIAVGYGWYARRIDRNVVQPDASKATPAKMYMDGVDFTPASRNVLFEAIRAGRVVWEDPSR